MIECSAQKQSIDSQLEFNNAVFDRDNFDEPKPVQ